ncbi:MAG: AAA family ATPase [Bacteroidales bacterium]
MINEICIEGFKSIRKQTIELSNINLLIGGNGIGKSNFVSLFTFVRQLYDASLSNYVIRKGGADRLLFCGRKITRELIVNISFSNKQGEVFNRFDVWLEEVDDRLLIRELGTAFKSGVWHKQTFETNVWESHFRNIRQGQAYWVNDLLREFEVFHFHDTGDLSPMKKKSNVSDNRGLRNDGSNLAAFLYYLSEKHPRHYRMIEMTISSIAPFFDGFILEPNRLNNELIELEWREKGSDTYYNAYQLSDGTLRFMALTTLLMQPNKPKIIIIDEPELGLHPVAINKLAAMIRKASHESQMIISTQSVNLVDQFDPEDVIVVERNDGASEFKRLNSQGLNQWLESYTLGEIWQKNIFGGQPLKR